jgi:hypothetical protein
MRRLILALAPAAFATTAAAFVGPAPGPRIATADVLTVAPPAAARAALERAVPGGWALEWDPQTRRLVSGTRGRIPDATRGEVAAKATAIAHADRFRGDCAALVGADAGELALVRCERWGRAWHVTWQQRSGGLPVVDAYLDVTLATGGAPVAFRATLVPAAPPAPATLDAVAALARLRDHLPGARVAGGAEAVAVRAGASLRPAWRLDLRGERADERWEAIVAADDGHIVRLESRVRTLEGTCRADIVARYHDDPPAPVPLAWLNVVLDESAGSRSTAADGAGRFAFAGTPLPAAVLRARLEGRYAVVMNAIGEPRSAVAHAVGAGTDVHFDAASGRLDERTIYAHATAIHDYARATFDFRLLDFPLPAVAGEPAYANAYWDGQGIHFGDGGTVFHNLGLFADIIYHEYTHGITDYMYRSVGGLTGEQGAALHEALSDYFACTLTGDSRLGEGMYRNNPFAALRDLENMLQWPRDRQGEEHLDGEIFGGALWDLRQRLGATIADPLVHFARALAPRTFEAYCNAVLLQDDLVFGDGQAANGSPHRGDILAAFALHGIGPAAGAGRALVHTPLGDTEAVGEPRTVRAGFEGHASTTSDSLVLAYSVGGAFAALAMERQPDGDFTAVLPGELLGEGTRVGYWIRTVARRGLPAQALPPGAPDSVYAFHVRTDAEPPRIDHAPLVRAAAITWPALLEARIDDNTGIAAAWVETWLDGVPGARLGFVRDAVDRSLYTTRFVNVGGVGSAVDYRIVAVDASRAGLVRCAPACDAVQRIAIVPTFAEDFEGSSGGFTHTSIRAGRRDVWRLGSPLDGSAGGAWVCGGDGGEYEPSLASALVSPSIQLGDAARARVRSWIDAEPNAAVEAFDAGVVEIEVGADGLWRPLAPQGGYTHVMAQTDGANVLVAGTPCLSGRDAAWRQLEFDLGAWAGRHVRLRFVFASDATPSPFGYRGWALDDFSVDPGNFDPSATAAAALSVRLQALPVATPGRGRVALELRVPPAAGRVSVRIYDVRGTRVRELWAGEAAPGVRRLEWDGTDGRGLARPAGVYYYRADSRRGSASGKLVLLR